MKYFNSTHLESKSALKSSIKHYTVLTRVKENGSQNFGELRGAKSFSVLLWGLGVCVWLVWVFFFITSAIQTDWYSFEQNSFSRAADKFQSCRQICIITVGLLCAVASGTAYWFHSCTYISQPFMWIWEDFLIRSCSDGVFFLRIAIHVWCQ